MYKKLLTNSAIYGILPQLPKLASLFVLPLITPYLTGADYGIIGVLSAYIGALSVFHLLGFNVVVLNSFYHHPHQYKWYWRQVYGFLMQWSFIFIFLLGILIYYTLPEEAHEHRWLIIAMKIIPLWIFGPSDMLASTYYRLNHKALPIASIALFVGIAGLGMNYYFIAVLKMGYMGWITSDFFTALISGVFFFIPVYRKWKLTPIFNYKRRLIKKALKVSLPIIPHYYGGYLLNSSDRVVMEQLNVPTEAIGRYSLAYNFGIYIETLSNAINQAIGPNLLELIKKERWKTYTKLIFVFQSIILLICFTLSLWVTQWVPLLIRNADLQNIHILLIIIIMSYSYRPMYVGCIQPLFFYEKTNILWRITLTAGLINIVGNLIFIPDYGILAAAITTFISLMYMAFAGFFLRVVKTYNKARIYPLTWFLIIIFSLLLLFIFYDAEIIVKIPVNILVFLSLGLLQFKYGVIRKGNDNSDHN